MLTKARTNKPLLLKGYLSFAMVVSIIALSGLALIPSDSKNAVFGGYSWSRLALLAGMALCFCFFVFVLIRVVISSAGQEKIIVVLDRILETEINRKLIFYSSMIASLTGTLFLLIPAERLDNLVYVIARLEPVVYWVVVIAIQTLLLQFLWSGGELHWRALRQRNRVLLNAGIVICVFAVVWGFMAWSRLGLAPEKSGWFSPGTPILFTQVIFAGIIGTGILYAGKLYEKRYQGSGRERSVSLNYDFLICVMLWVAVILAWYREPLQKWSYFTPAPTPPNFEYYPYSDAALYDEFAHGILIGIGREIGLMHRPLYAFFLAFLHQLAGLKNEGVILLQIAALAVIPILIYLIASNLGSRLGGLIAAILVIFREKNSIALTNVIEVSHSKLLLSDVPTMALILLFVYVLIRWLQDTDRKTYLAVLTGTALGLVVLIRSQALLLIPVVFLGLVIFHWKRWRKIFYDGSLFLLGLLVLIGPWVSRNYQVSGRVVVEDTEFYIRFLASGYRTPEESIDIRPGEPFDEYYDRMKSQIADYIINHPGEVARRYTSHFLHNEIETIIYLPMSLKLYDLRLYVKQVGYWAKPLETFSFGSVILLIFNLGLISLGIGMAVERTKFVGLIPVLIHLGYSFSVVPTGQSGWRFILPVDWIALVYYSIGLVFLWGIIISIFTKKNAFPEPGIETIDVDINEPRGIHRKKILQAAVASLILGLSFPVMEGVIPAKYPEKTPSEIIQEYIPESIKMESAGLIYSSNLDSFLSNNKDAVVLYGRALYPSFYEKGRFWGEENQYISRVKEYDRLQFSLIGPDRAQVYIPLARPPQSFPHGSDVVVIGCRIENSVKALLVLVIGQDEVLSISPWSGLTCE